MLKRSPEAQVHADWLDAVAQTQSRTAFENLFEYYAPRLKTFLRRQGLGDAQAEETIQDVMLIVWTKAKLFDRSKSSVSTWIFRIARNKRIDLYRRGLRSVFDVSDPSLQPGAPPAPDKDLMEKQMSDQVSNVLSDIPDNIQNLLRASFYEGRTHAEISKQFNLPLGTVKTRIRKGFAIMRERLDSDDIKE